MTLELLLEYNNCQETNEQNSSSDWNYMRDQNEPVDCPIELSRWAEKRKVEVLNARGYKKTSNFLLYKNDCWIGKIIKYEKIVENKCKQKHNQRDEKTTLHAK